MTIGTIITGSRHIALSSRERKIPWDEPAFSQRMLENHLSQEHDWASRRRAVIEQQVAWDDIAVIVRGTGSGREQAIRAIQASGIEVKSIMDDSPVPHNGCRPKKKFRA